TTVTAAPDPSKAGQPVTYTVLVKSTTGLMPDGTVTLTDNGNPVGTPNDGNLTPNPGAGGATATFTIDSATAGPHTLTAHYDGNTNLNAS
uniref:Ig-like domain-containing protein n=1 Tax=Kitasatospora sp. MBT63 TaxID=1444768 RepID=UPI0011EA66B8